MDLEKKKLSENAQAVYNAHAGKQVNWESLKVTLRTPDPSIIARAWNELRAAGLTRGTLSSGELCRILSEPEA